MTTFNEHYSGYKWVKVKKYTVDDSLSWEDKYKALESHHVAETSFLIEEIRKLATMLDKKTSEPEPEPRDKYNYTFRADENYPGSGVVSDFCNCGNQAEIIWDAFGGGKCNKCNGTTF